MSASVLPLVSMANGVVLTAVAVVVFLVFLLTINVVISSFKEA